MNKKRINIFLWVITIAFAACLATQAQEGRSKININRQWQFMLGDIQPDIATHDNNSEWQNIALPHTFSLPYFMGKKVYEGYGWYRKSLNIPSEWIRKNITLEFEGAFIEKEVYINGKYVGKHVGGYTGFFFDITDFVKPGENILTVRVNNLWKPNVAPRAGDHQFSGGIYRDVYLNITDKLHIDCYGTFVSTPQVSKKSANFLVQTEVRNNYDADRLCTVQTQIKAPDGKIVASHKSTTTVAKGKVEIVKQELKAIKKPELWSPETPSLYKAITTIYHDGKAIDSYETPFGIRKFEWTADKGFLLNGEHYYLLGANVHQDQAGWGDAVTNAAIRRDVQMMKDVGFNCIRGSHYPHDPSFSQACDEIGIIFFQENAFWGMGGSTGDKGWGTPSSSCYPPNPNDQSAFDQSVLSQLKEMIKIHRNHASIAAWSMCNEPFFTDAVTDEPMKCLLNMATDSTRAWDPTREVAIGGAQRKDVDRLGKGAIAFYNGDGATLYTNPGFPNMVSEYGSTTAQRPGRFIPGWGDLKDGFERPEWRSGQVIWCGFDHGTVGGEALATMGMIDYFRIPKRQYYWYQEAYAKGNRSPQEPEWPAKGTPAGLRLEASNKTITSIDGTDDAQLIVTVLDASGKHISNNVPVELAILSGPGEFPTGTKIKFMPPSQNEASDISIRDGQAAIAFRSYYAGKTVIKASSPGLESDTIHITTFGDTQWVEGVIPQVENRPYKRYVAPASNETKTDANMMLLAINRPSWVSSTLDGTSKAYANDGNSQTCWKPSATDKERWWKLALEAAYDIDKIQLEFPEARAYRYTIEISIDDKEWTTIVDQTNNESTDKMRIFNGNFGKNIAFIRITFTSDIAGLTEVKVGGSASSQ